MSATVTDYAEQVKELIESTRCAEPSYNCEESAPLHERDLFNSIATALQQVHDAAILAERERIVDWLAHRCDYAPVCGNCTYCRVAKWITVEGQMK